MEADTECINTGSTLRKYTSTQLSKERKWNEENENKSKCIKNRSECKIPNEHK